jgi:3-oxoacyl-[acyl-carrier protein] reductase
MSRFFVTPAGCIFALRDRAQKENFGRRANKKLSRERKESLVKLKDRVAVVTGGSTGIGRATCLALAHEGAGVLVNYLHSQAEAEEVVRTIEGAGGHAQAVRADVSRDEEARALIEAAMQRFGRLDILVNNAGWTRRVPHHDLDSLTEEIIERTLAVNTRGPLYCARAAIPNMRRNGGGFIVNITSIAGRLGVGSSMIYAGSKAALAVMTRSLARAFAPEIRVNAIAPGFIDTGFADWPPEAIAQARQQVHIGRLVSVEDIAAAVLFLVTDGSALTGEEFVVDGGMVSLGPRNG